MKPRLLKGNQADYEEATWDGENTSGFEPVGDYVLVKTDKCSRMTAGGIHLPDDQLERMDLAAESGCIFAVGGGAFTRFDDGRAWTSAKPVPGDRVAFERYAGIPQKGRDGANYRIMGYRNIAGLLSRAEGES